MVDASRAGVQRAASPLPGFGVSPKTLFLLVCSPPAAAREKKEVPGDTPDPGRENPAPLQDIHQLRENSYHKPSCARIALDLKWR